MKSGGKAATKRRRSPARRSQRDGGARTGEPAAGASKQTPLWKTREAKLTVFSTVLAGVIGILGTLINDALSGGNGPDAQPPGVGSRTPAAATGAPLRVAEVRYVPRRDDHSWVMANPLAPSALGSLNRGVARAGGGLSDTVDPVMRAAGAIDPTASTVELALEGNRPGPVLITGIHVVAQCRKPLNGTLFYNPPQGVTDTVKLGFDLDSPSPIAQYSKPDPNDGPPIFYGDYFADHKYRLNQGDEVTFRLTARSFKSYCEYHYRFDLIVDGHVQSQPVDDSGRPFKVTAAILAPPDRRGALQCRAYRRVYIGRNLMPGRIANLPSWNVPKNGDRRYC